MKLQLWKIYIKVDVECLVIAIPTCREKQSLGIIFKNKIALSFVPHSSQRQLKVLVRYFFSIVLIVPYNARYFPIFTDFDILNTINTDGKWLGIC